MLPLLQRYLALVIPFLWKDQKSKVATTTTLLLIGVETLAATASPVLFGRLIQSYRQLSPSHVFILTTLLILCWAIHKTFLQLRNMVFFRVVNQAIRDIRMKVILHMHKLPWHAQATYDIAEVLSASNRIAGSLRQFMHISLARILPALFKIGTLSTAMLYVKLSTWYFPPLVLLTYGYVYVGMRRFVRSRCNVWELSDKVMTAMDDSLHNTNLIRFHLDVEAKRLRKLFDTEAQGWLRNNTYLYTINFVQAVLFFVVTGCFTIHLVTLLRAGQLTVPDFVVLKGYVFAIYAQVCNITNQIRSLLSSMVDLKKVLEILSLSPHTVQKALPPFTSVQQAPPIIQVQQLTFAYDTKHKNILQHCDFNLHRGDKVAIMGRSGVGKSTLCHLLAGIYWPTQGDILLHGVSIRQLSLVTIGRVVHFVHQEAAIRTGSITDNLMAEQKIMQTAPLAYLKNRMDQTTGDKGNKLSSGEKQRILIARCLTYKPEVLILDETLSELDEESALDLLKLVLAHIPTVIFVTHRHSLTKGFGHIYQLKDLTLRPLS